MRSPVTSLKEWWVNRSTIAREPIAPPSSEEIKPNITFRHSTHCLKREGITPCGCFPRYRAKMTLANKFAPRVETEVVREFWVTPHPNRRLRRQLASKAWQRAQRAGTRA